MRTSNVITKVIQSCLDDERTLVRESKVVDAPRSAILTHLADERRSFSEELERLNGPIGRGSLGSWGALVREMGNDLWMRAAGRNTHDAIAMCRSSQLRTQVQYEKALEVEWPSELKAALEAQHERVRAARQELAEIEY